MNQNVFKRKSEFNKSAVELLLKKGLPSPSIKCSYYSCVQMMLYIIYDKMNYTKSRFDKERFNGHKMGTHKYAIKIIIQFIKSHRNDFRKGLYKKFKWDIEELKGMREKADYEDCIITHDMGEEAKTLSIKILSRLNDINLS